MWPADSGRKGVEQLHVNIGNILRDEFEGFQAH
jgi:hypothetical protein